MANVCDLCDGDGGQLVFKNDSYRVVLVDEAAYPGFCRVIWNGHFKEMTDLSPADRSALMNAVWAVEAAVREVMQPEKINVASLGNMTPHVHWHVIPRYTDDAHFPSPVWAEAKRESAAATLEQRRAKLPQLRAAIMRHLSSMPS
ncbi:HIT family protein [Herbaspirillum sp. RV1423]|uniref:HIT family protein n=1 Tax=Herbaspirillum sp. RV1423 TaxID=1443993 RepID=UPI0004BC5BAD|nr:HIT family protein [Herbaspirillum sp. RV1423]